MVLVDFTLDLCVLSCRMGYVHGPGYPANTHKLRTGQ